MTHFTFLVIYLKLFFYQNLNLCIICIVIILKKTHLWGDNTIIKAKGHQGKNHFPRAKHSMCHFVLVYSFNLQ